LETQLKETQKAISISNLGRHILAEFYNCDSNILNNARLIETAMEQAAVECGATVVEKVFHMFSPYGVSGVVIISESHLAVHTWPEYGYAAVDLFTCGDSCDPLVAYECLKNKLNAGSAIYTELQRGMLDNTKNEVMVSPFRIKTHID
jgi:S-adenosylmethionine decarboxylase proenzyme